MQPHDHDLIPDPWEEEEFSTPSQIAPESGAVIARRRARVTGGRYRLPPVPGHPEVGRRGWTRATTLAKSISDTYTLSLWQQRAVAVGVATRPELIAMAAAHPDLTEHRDLLNEVCEDAKRHANTKVRASLGTALHAFTERHDRGELSEDLREVPEAHRPEVAIWRDVVARYGLEVPAELIERVVIVPEVEAAGTFDRIALTTRELRLPTPSGHVRVIPPGEWVVLDLKTGRDLEYGWNEIAIQLALYARAPLIWDWADGYVPMPPVRTDTALVVHLPVGERRGSLTAVDIGQGWEGAKLCHAVRRWRANRTVTAPVEVVELAEHAEIHVKEAVFARDADGVAEVLTPEIRVQRATVTRRVSTEGLAEAQETAGAVQELLRRGPTDLERVRAASSVGELVALWYELRPAGRWTKSVSTAATHRRKSLETP